ncbi:hypothetical protein BCR34DRAFT_501596 [Clohesyomyces aquaticus]|uniref:Uncharacterized protein n=1 Tax=Clohesyomyces aquaticus TaxID=1231657 RepID=A0A1Y1XZK3_9PLEO|nr:hypothetical protein BCR34DRAFT_501596 [Clohesyomyces aquaticus]
MASNKYYISLPTQAPQHSRPGSRRPPLTPSTVSSPCLTTHAPVATRRDSGSSSGSPTSASTLLAKVASHPASPRNEHPATNAVPSSPSTEMHTNPLYTPERPQAWRTESARYVRQYKKQDGYISFPDFEKFCATQNPYDNQHREHTAVKT